MKAEDIIAYRARYGEAQDVAGKLDAVADQLEATGLCNVSTRMHLKTLERDLADGLAALSEKMDRLHGSPKLKEDFFGWLRCNYQWIIICLLAIKATNLSGTIRELLELFR